MYWQRNQDLSYNFPKKTGYRPGCEFFVNENDSGEEFFLTNPKAKRRS